MNTRVDGAILDDKRTPEDVSATACYVVALDSFMSGWGQAKRHSIFAVPCKDYAQAEIVFANMKHRSEMKYARIVGRNWRPKLYAGDHCSIRDMSDCSRFYTPGGFSAD